MAKGKLARCNKWMFQTVECSAYMKKVKDGRSGSTLPQGIFASGRCWKREGGM